MDSLPAGRWMAARAEFPCGLTGGECGIGAALDVGGVSFFAVCREGIGE